VDAVLLVDNATQPMQAAPVAAMRNLASGGEAGKLIVCFTHFDVVGGDNLPTFKSKETRIKALSRRLAEGWDDEYLQLKPLADLHRELRESIYRFIQNPVSWSGAVPSDNEKQ
jgi:hypothetical protein